jgi:hypothetical protein
MFLWRAGHNTRYLASLVVLFLVLVVLLVYLRTCVAWQLSILGEGSFGVVVLAADLRRNEAVAVKLIPRGPQLADFSRYVKREILHQSTLR